MTRKRRSKTVYCCAGCDWSGQFPNSVNSNGHDLMFCPDCNSDDLKKYEKISK